MLPAQRSVRGLHRPAAVATQSHVVPPGTAAAAAAAATTAAAAALCPGPASIHLSPGCAVSPSLPRSMPGTSEEGARNEGHDEGGGRKVGRGTSARGARNPPKENAQNTSFGQI